MPGIAIVEDEYIVALDIKGFLERAGYGVAGLFASGEELLRQFDDIKPDLILMDIKIHGQIDGVETASLVHEKYRIPVVLLTAYADDETVARAKITQPFGYIIKPFEERELRTAIEIALYRAGMEKRLRESEDRYRRLFNEGISGNFLADANGRITDANPAFRKLLGIGPDDPLSELGPLFLDQSAWESFRQAILSARRFELIELMLRGYDGRDLLVLANAAAFSDGDGNIIGIQGELTDITERRRLEERLLQAQKMEAVGRLAGGIAHDFNNILTAILGYANLLADEIPEAREALEDLDGIRKAAARAANLTRQLLAFSRRQPFSPHAMDLNAQIQETEKMLRRLLTEDVTLTLFMEAQSPVVVADPIQIEQILLNLAVNARDAMSLGGNLSIATRNRSAAAPFTVGLDTLAPGDYVVLEVGDTGTGIPSEIRDRIFEPFFTTKPKERGTGLGLSMVYGIVKQSGGAIGVESEVDQGAVFSVWLPLAHESPNAPADEIEKRIPKRKSATILFVDDDEALRFLASKFLARQGHRVLIAANAGEAILIAESYENIIDLLVTDMVMPFMDGYTLARRLGALRPGIGVLFVSGHPDRAADAEAVGRFLPKPFTEKQLAEAISEALGRLDSSRRPG